MKIGWIDFGNRHYWKYSWVMRKDYGWFGIFRNREGIKPGRWGFRFLGFEFGSRNPGHWFGVLLKRAGLWPWLLLLMLPLSGCATRHAEGTVTACYGGVTVASTWKVEVIR